MRRIVLLLALLWPPILAGPIEEARTLMEQGRYEQAVAVLEEALRDEALKPAALVEITRLYNETQDYEKGVDYGEQAVEALPESSTAHLEYARALKFKMNEISRMRATFLIGTYKKELRKALELDPQNVEARVEEIGFFLHAPGIIGGSETKAQERIDRLKQTAWRDAMLMQAELQRKQEDPAGAIRTYDEMIGRDAEDKMARQALAFALQSSGKYREADPHFGVLLEGDDARRSMMARYQLARSRVLGEYEQLEAVDYLLGYIERLTDSIRGVPSESSAYWRLGLAYKQLGRVNEAREALERAVALDGDNEQAQESLQHLKRS
jgi:tetratricopeptide (TPR) repeat protein